VWYDQPLEKDKIAMQSAKSARIGTEATPSQILAQRAQLALSKVQGRPVHLGFGDTETYHLPQSVTPLLIEILAELALGNQVKILSTASEVTTQQAANILNVSRPYLVGLLDAKKIPSRKVGTHRRVKIEDVLSYKDRISAVTQDKLSELAEQAQDLAMGY
jgi:excisionase family DNA binding protein